MMVRDIGTRRSKSNYLMWLADKRYQEREKDNELLNEEYHNEHIEPEICRHFGCAKTLTLQEKRFGDKCIDHSKEENINMIMVLKFK